ncbi:MAG: hypothetical protein KKD44_02020 [Proteobacteria bacterium]|nr:hypothetical protein [Pseudomonadota bacterium]
MRIKLFVLAIFLLLVPDLVFCAVDASKSYLVGVEAYEGCDYKKAVRFLENSIEAGLSGNKLVESYCKLYFCAFELKDQKRLSKYESLCSYKNLTLHLTFEELKSVEEENALIIKDILKKRLEKSTFKKHSIEVIKKGNRIVYIVSIFKVNNPEKAIDLISKSGQLQLSLLDDESNLMNALKGNIPKDCKILYQIQERNNQILKIPFLVKGDIWNINNMINNTKIHIDKSYNTPNIIIKLNSDGTELLGNITANNIKKRLAIILDNQILSAPVIQGQINTGTFLINGDGIEEVKDMALLLSTKSYPIPSTILAIFNE